MSSSLLLIDGPDSNGQDIQKSLQNYGIYYPGTYFTSAGNFTSNNDDYMKIPSGNIIKIIGETEGSHAQKIHFAKSSRKVTDVFGDVRNKMGGCD